MGVACVACCMQYLPRPAGSTPAAPAAPPGRGDLSTLASFPFHYVEAPVKKQKTGAHTPPSLERNHQAARLTLTACYKRSGDDQLEAGSEGLLFTARSDALLRTMDSKAWYNGGTVLLLAVISAAIGTSTCIMCKGAFTPGVNVSGGA